MYKENWEDRLIREYQASTLEELRELLKDAYDIALDDNNYENQYTHLVLFNLKFLSQYGIEKISFKQWKSFRAYVHSNKMKNANIENLFPKKSEAVDVLIKGKNYIKRVKL